MTDSLRPRLVALQGSQTLLAREIAVGEEWTLGRGPDSALPLQERSISRAHARIFCDATGVHLLDLGSPNGTWIDGRPAQGQVTLKDGNVIRLGQSTNPEPILLRFEDPGTRLLEAMSDAPPPSAPAAAPSAVAVPADDASAPTMIVGSGSTAAAAAAGPPAVRTSVPPAVSTAAATGAPPVMNDGAEAADANVAADDSPDEVEPTLAARLHLDSPWTIVAVGGVVLILAGWLIFALRITQKPWQSVRVEPQRVKAGSRAALRGTEIEPSDTLKVFVGDKEAAIESMGPGQVLFSTPPLGAGEAGVHPVVLKVERKGIVLLRQNVQYEIVPEVQAVEPAKAAVGDVVSLTGSGFVSDPRRIKIKVGQVTAAVEAATPGEIRFRVPVVTRNVEVDLPVAITVAEWSAPPTSLKVRPREAPCFVLDFVPRYLSGRVWEVRSALGPALEVEGAAPSADGSAGSTAPAPVQQAADVLKAAFEKAGGDSAVHFEVKDQGKSATLVAVGLGNAPREVAAFTPALVAFARERAPDLRQTELLPYWSSVVLNELLNAFAKRQPPRFLPADNPLRKVLQRLHDVNVETGGQGCPSGSEVETLTAEEREVLEGASQRLPVRFGDVGGAWEGALENAFADKATDITLELRLELQQAGTALKGKALVFEVRGEGIRWSPAPIEGLEGRVRLGAETRVDLKFPPIAPYAFTQLTATLGEDSLEGTLRTAKNKQGRFLLKFKPGE
jgi:hypothetical protein